MECGWVDERCELSNVVCSVEWRDFIVATTRLFPVSLSLYKYFIASKASVDCKKLK